MSSDSRSRLLRALLATPPAGLGAHPGRLAADACMGHTWVAPLREKRGRRAAPLPKRQLRRAPGRPEICNTAPHPRTLEPAQQWGTRHPAPERACLRLRAVCTSSCGRIRSCVPALSAHARARARARRACRVCIDPPGRLGGRLSRIKSRTSCVPAGAAHTDTTPQRPAKSKVFHSHSSAAAACSAPPAARNAGRSVVAVDDARLTQC